MKLARIVHAVKHTDHGPVGVDFRTYLFEKSDLNINKHFVSGSPGADDSLNLLVIRLEDVSRILRLSQYDLTKLKKDGVLRIHLGVLPDVVGGKKLCRRVVPLDDVGHLLKLDFTLAGEKFVVHKVEYPDGATTWEPK